MTGNPLELWIPLNSKVFRGSRCSIARFGFTVWIHDVSDVWMNGWVLKKLSKEVFDGFADDVKDIKQELITTYVCMCSSCEKEHNP